MLKCISKELQLANKEKVIRIILQLLLSLSRSDRCIEQMIQNNMHNIFENISKRNLEDTDVIEDI